MASSNTAATDLALLALLPITPDIFQLLPASIDADGQAPASLQSYQQDTFTCCCWCC